MVVTTVQPRTSFVFTVTGTPVAQGSMVIMKGHIRHSDDKRLVAWRKEIAVRCQEEMRDTKHWKPDYPPLYKPWAGPVSLALYFAYTARTKGDSGEWKTTAPDIDKLTRAVLDALTGVLYEDDRQVALLEVSKQYADWMPASEGGREESSLTINARMLA